MDTPTAITTLSTLSQNIGAEITKLITEQQAVDIAVKLLQQMQDAGVPDLDAVATTLASIKSSPVVDAPVQQ